MIIHEAAQALMSGVPGGTSTRGQGVDAIKRIRGIALQGEAAARLVMDALGAVAEALETRRPSGALPSEEQAVWQDAGAVFGDKRAVVRSRARTATRFADLMSRSVHGDAALARQLGVDPSRVSQRVRDRSIYAFQGREGRYFPQWQFVGKGRRETLPKLKSILSRLDPNLHPLTVDHWFNSPNVDLVVGDEPVTPIEWLGTGGDPERVAALAEDL